MFEFKPAQLSFLKTLPALGFTVENIRLSGCEEVVTICKEGVTMMYSACCGVWVEYYSNRDKQLVWGDEGMGFNCDSEEDRNELVILLEQIIQRESK